MEKVVAALHDLIEQGSLDPTADEVAAHAGVSRRLVFHHFRSIEAIYERVIERQAARIAESFVAVDADLPFPVRLSRFVDSRAVLFERITPVRRSALLREHASPAVAASLEMGRSFFRADAERLFTRELDARGDEARRSVCSALGACSSWSHWWALRHEQSLGVAEAKASLKVTLASLLHPTRGAASSPR